MICHLGFYVFCLVFPLFHPTGPPWGVRQSPVQVEVSSDEETGAPPFTQAGFSSSRKRSDWSQGKAFQALDYWLANFWMGGGFRYFFCFQKFTSIFGEDSHFD